MGADSHLLPGSQVGVMIASERVEGKAAALQVFGEMDCFSWVMGQGPFNV
jgi:hypothetical protein